MIKKVNKVETTKTKEKTPKKEVYLSAVGRRRQAIARIRLYPHQKGVTLVNTLPIEQYFPGEINKKIYQAPLRTCNALDKYLITIKVSGSGKAGQLGAVIHGLSRVLIKLDLEKNRPILKKRGFLTRDPRKRQRRMAGMGGKSRRKKQSPRR